MDETKMNHKENSIEFDKNSQIKHKRRTVKVLIAVAVLLVVVIVICAAYNAGFIPITNLLSVKKPVGDSVELNVDEYLKEYPGLNEIPNLDKIKKAAYGTDASIDTVISDYTEKLNKEGYSLKYEGAGDLDENSFQYYGFLKGITAVVIIVTSNNNGEIGNKTVVLYTTGNALDFKAILDWYENQ
jgi:hypothetical protein